MWDIDWSRRALENLRAVPAFHRRRILLGIDDWLMSSPNRPNRKRIKRLEHLRVPWSEEEGTWQLRVDPYRVFYDLVEFFPDEREGATGLVLVQAVCLKPHGAKTEDIL
jgi:mRNA-degrading endonuclease RelE of RelBE toxin-antitoxin system